MFSQTWSSWDWDNIATHHHTAEDWYYWDQCILAYFSPFEYTKIVKPDRAKQVLAIWKDVLARVKEYIRFNNLEYRWKFLIDELFVLSNEVELISNELDTNVSQNNLKKFYNIQLKAFTLKERITESEVFAKYLKHKEMNQYRNKGKNQKNDININNSSDF